MIPLVITTINNNTKALKEFEKQENIFPIIIGDKKGPKEFQTKGQFLSLDDQLDLSSSFAKICPTNHYSRKNIGYIIAKKFGSTLILESDDDNCPYSGWLESWPKMDLKLNVCKTNDKSEWINIYELFSDKKIWPRGFPLSKINNNKNILISNSRVKIGVWQGLANGEPDVDAIYRLTNVGETIFKENQIALSSGTYCPINSQNTLWQFKFIPLMYLPCTVSFRYTDILRGIIAQHLLFCYGYTVGFCSANVYQDRNEHNLITDFQDEIEMYKHQENILDILRKTHVSRNSIQEDVMSIYRILSNNGVVDSSELDFLQAYLEDL